MNGPQLWSDIIQAVNFPGAVVAGGCIRDWRLNVPPKDIDVFIPCKDMQEWLDWKYSFFVGGKHLWADLADTQAGKEYERTDFSREANPLYGVIEGTLLDYQVNVIARTSHTSNEALVELFDFAVLQAWWDGDSLKYTSGQAIDCQHQTATMTHDKHVAQSINRFMRFNARNPGVLSLNIPFETPYALAQ